MTFNIGDCVADYQILKLIGRGGMGAVFLALDRRLDRHVALKVMNVTVASDDFYVERFRQEASRLAGLAHPFIVHLYGVGEHQGQLWMAMQFVESGRNPANPGTPQCEDLGRRMKAGMSDAQMLAVLRNIAKALDYIHSKGVVHRDLKPGNILLDAQGEAYLADFGLAKLYQGSAPSTAMMGTPEYMAPEQCMAKLVGPPADIYALGVIAYQWLAGNVPFQADTPVAIALAHVQQEVPEAPLAARPAPAVAAIRTALHKQPDGRFRSATGFIQALESGLSAVSPAAAPAATMPPNGSPRRPAAVQLASGVSTAERRADPSARSRRWWLAVTAGAGAVLIGTFLVARWWPNRQPVSPVAAGETVALPSSGGGDAVVTPSSPSGTLRLLLEPPDASLQVNGESLGAGGRELKYPVGRVIRIDVQAAGYLPLQRELTVAAGTMTETLRLTVRPRPAGTIFRDRLRDGSEGPDMVVMPAGRYLRGGTDPAAEADEKPVREVQLKSFALGKHEVTRAEFARFVQSTGYRTDAEKNTDVPDSVGEYAKGANAGCYTFSEDGRSVGFRDGTSWHTPGFPQANERHPAVCLSWNDVQAFVKWLAAQTGQPYRLPSEAEQEYALRAGERVHPFPWGPEVEGACQHANVADQSGSPFQRKWSEAIACDDKIQGTAPVGAFAVNAFGLHDTTGNALEWAQDCYASTYAAAPLDGSAASSTTCTLRVLRGGAWYNGRPLWLRAADRDRSALAYRSHGTGVRVAEDL